MYDDEAEIKRKRRNLIIAIAAVGGLILLLIIILIALGSSSGKKKTNYVKPTCELKVMDDVKQTSSGAYTGPITIGIEKITVSKGYTITTQKVGITNSPRNGETYKLSKSGKTVVYGYVTDSKGEVGECKKEFEIQTSRPNCQLKVASGTVGEDGWYTSDVVVTFDSKTVENGTIEKYYIEEVKKDAETKEIITRAPETNNDSLTVKTDAELEVMGTVVDNYGVSGTCTLQIKKDAEKPTCNLEVRSGTAGKDGSYSDNVVVGIEKAEDTVSGMAGQGIGIKENYTEETFTVTDKGKTTVVGYVKDKAGNKGECTLDITKTTGSSSGSNKSNPSCKLSVTYKGKLGDSYLDYVKVGFKDKTTDNGAEIVEYGLGTSAQLNGSSSLRLEQEGKYTVYGMVKDSNGVTAECRATFSIVKEKVSEPSCSLYVDATQLSDGTYSKGATVKFRTKTSTNGAQITNYGIGTEYKLSGNDTFSVGVGTYKVYGMVKDSYGHEAKCGPIDFTVTSQSSGGSGGSGSGGSGSGEGSGSGSTTTGQLASTVLKQGDIVSYKSYKSVTCENKSDVASRNNWEVFRVTNGTVELISTGIPECYNFALGSKASTAISEMKTRAKTYLDSSLASASRIMTRDDALVYGGAEDLKAGAKRNTGVYYWLATQGSATTQLYGVRNGGAPSKTGFIFDGSGRNYGIRPIVTLKSNVYATKNSSGVWVLSVPTKEQQETPENSMFDKLIEIVNSTLLADFKLDE